MDAQLRARSGHAAPHRTAPHHAALCLTLPHHAHDWLEVHHVRSHVRTDTRKGSAGCDLRVNWTIQRQACQGSGTSLVLTTHVHILPSCLPCLVGLCDTFWALSCISCPLPACSALFCPNCPFLPLSAFYTPLSFPPLPSFSAFSAPFCPFLPFASFSSPFALLSARSSCSPACLPFSACRF